MLFEPFGYNPFDVIDKNIVENIFRQEEQLPEMPATCIIRHHELSCQTCQQFLSTQIIHRREKLISVDTWMSTILRISLDVLRTIICGLPHWNQKRSFNCVTLMMTSVCNIRYRRKTKFAWRAHPIYYQNSASHTSSFDSRRHPKTLSRRSDRPSSLDNKRRKWLQSTIMIQRAKSEK